MKTAAYLVETLFDPVTGHSEEPNEAAFQRAHRSPLPCYEWLEQPENILSLRKFPNAMRATTHYNSDTVVTQGYEWDKLPEGSLVIDVAGGIGNLTMALASTHKHLRYVVQDRPAVIKAAFDVRCFLRLTSLSSPGCLFSTGNRRCLAMWRRVWFAWKVRLYAHLNPRPQS